MTIDEIREQYTPLEKIKTIDGVEYPMKDPIFPTVSKENPYELTPGERNLMDKLCQSFAASQKLAQHLRLLLDKGSMYLVCNGNLLFHASVPMNTDGTFREINICGKTLSGKAYLDEVDRLIRIACLPSTICGIGGQDLILHHSTNTKWPTSSAISLAIKNLKKKFKVHTINFAPILQSATKYSTNSESLANIVIS